MQQGEVLATEVLNYNYGSGLQSILLSDLSPGHYTIKVDDQVNALNVRASHGFTIAEGSMLPISNLTLYATKEMTAAQTTGQVYLRGTFNAWQADETMLLVADYTWRVSVAFDAPGRFNFDLNGDWTMNYGDNNNDGFAEANGNDIFIAEAGVYEITFNESNLSYSVNKL